jgi:hypothetical protein
MTKARVTAAVFVVSGVGKAVETGIIDCLARVTAAVFVVSGDLPAMFTVRLLTVLFTSTTASLTSRATGVSLATSTVGSMPGGLT